MCDEFDLAIVDNGSKSGLYKILIREEIERLQIIEKKVY